MPTREAEPPLKERRLVYQKFSTAGLEDHATEAVGFAIA